MISGGKGRTFCLFPKISTPMKEKVEFPPARVRHWGPLPCPVRRLGAAGKIMTERACTTKKGGCPDVHFTWEKVAKRITEFDSERAAISPNRNRRSSTKSRRKRLWPKKMPCKPSRPTRNLPMFCGRMCRSSPFPPSGSCMSDTSPSCWRPLPRTSDTGTPAVTVIMKTL